MFWSIKYIHNREYKMYWQNEKIAKLWVLSIFLTKEGLNKYIKLLCEMKLWDKLRRCSVKKVFLEISQNLPENTCAGVSFLIKSQVSQHRCFQVNFVEFFKNTFLQNGCFFIKDLFLSIFCNEKSFKQISSNLLV